MRKRLIGDVHPAVLSSSEWLDLRHIAEVEVSSEGEGYRIENAFAEDKKEWRAAVPGPQTIRLLFDQPQTIKRIRLVIVEEQHERDQKFELFWSAGKDHPLQKILSQQFFFSPSGAVREVEEYRTDLSGVGLLELRIDPDRNGGLQHASLNQFLVT